MCHQKYFDIGFNDRLRWYDFVVNKPTLIDPEVVKGNHKIRQCVSQMMTLVQELPLVVGDKIPEKITTGNVLLIAITKICLSPRISHHTIAFFVGYTQKPTISLNSTTFIIPHKLNALALMDDVT